MLHAIHRTLLHTVHSKERDCDSESCNNTVEDSCVCQVLLLGSECSVDTSRAWQWSTFTTMLPTPKYKITYFVADVIVLLFLYNVYSGIRANKTDMLISLHKCKKIQLKNDVHQ